MQDNAMNMVDTIEQAGAFIDHDYLERLDSLRIEELSKNNLDFDLVRLFRISKLAYDVDEDSLQKMVNVYSAMQPYSSDLVLLIVGDGQRVNVYFGVHSNGTTKEGMRSASIFGNNFKANFQGSIIQELCEDEVSCLLREHVPEDKSYHVANLTMVPSLRQETEKKYRPGLEKFVETLREQKFFCEIIASPVSRKTLKERTSAFEELYTTVSPLVKTTISNGSNEGVTVTRSVSRSFARSISTSLAQSSGKNFTHTDGTNKGVNFGVPLLHALNIARGSMSSDSEGSSKQLTETEQRGTTETDTYSDSQAKTLGTSNNVTIEHINMRAQRLLEKISAHLQRLWNSKVFGLWECSAYFAAQNLSTVVTAASTYRAMIAGEQSSIEDSHITVFRPDHVDELLTHLRYCHQPEFNYFNRTLNIRQLVTATNYVGSQELPLLFCLPQKSIPGLPILAMAEFGQTFHQEAEKEERQITLGEIYHMGIVQHGNSVCLNLDAFASHCFVTGTTGSGKSNTIYGLIGQFIEAEIPFLVIEPAKGEYKEQFGGLKDISIYTTNSSVCEMLRINPFRFDTNIHILEHLDRLIEIFNTCWEMYAAMPAILKDAIEQSYVEKGWDLLNSQYLNEGMPAYPNFSDLIAILPGIIEKSGYSGETSSDYIGALVTRVRSLANGIYGQIFCNEYDVVDSELFDNNVIIDLSRVGSSETKSLIMGILVLRLTEYRAANAQGANSRLRHVTVLEEAHNLLKNTVKGNASAGNNVISKSVEMISNSIAEMRTYGEGFIIVDQSPTAVDETAIKNTNTKIVMRLPDAEDCRQIGHALALRESQIAEIPKLVRGVAVVMQNNWQESVLTQMSKASDKFQQRIVPIPYEALRKFRADVASEVICQFQLDEQCDVEEIYKIIDGSDVNQAKKHEMRCIVEQAWKKLSTRWENNTFGRTLVQLTNCQDVFRVAEKHIKNTEDGTYQAESIGKWSDYVTHQLEPYIHKEQQALFMKYIIFAMQYETHAVDYHKVYHMIY